METIIKFYEDTRDESIDIDGSIDYSRGYVHHNLFLPYSTLKSILKLDEKTRAIDEVLLNNAHVALERYLSRVISLRRIEEDVCVKGGVIIPSEAPIKSVVSIVDTEMQQDIDMSLVSFDSSSIKIANNSHDGNICRLHYTAGYESGEGEAELAEAVVKTFLLKRHALYTEMNDSQSVESSAPLTYSLTDEIKSLLTRSYEQVRRPDSRASSSNSFQRYAEAALS